jgi:hypothetical protein
MKPNLKRGDSQPASRCSFLLPLGGARFAGGLGEFAFGAIESPAELAGSVSSVPMAAAPPLPHGVWRPLTLLP